MSYLGIMLAVPGLVLLIAALAQYLQNRSYAACAEDIMATVEYKHKRKTKNGTVFELRVVYNVDGIGYKKNISVFPDEFDAVEEGGKIMLKYKPNNPKKCVSPRTLNPKNARITLIIGLVLTVSGVALYFIGSM